MDIARLAPGVRAQVWARNGGLIEDEREDGNNFGYGVGLKSEAIGQQRAERETHLVLRQIASGHRLNFEVLGGSPLRHLGKHGVLFITRGQQQIPRGFDVAKEPIVAGEAAGFHFLAARGSRFAGFNRGYIERCSLRLKNRG